MGARAGGASGGMGRGASLPDLNMGVNVKGNPLQTAIYNSQLQAKNAGGLVFQVSPTKQLVLGQKNYGLHIEGKGWIKFKGDKGPFVSNRKSVVAMIQKSGLLGYDNIEFINPIK